MKYFIITVDTEGDNLWNYKQGDEISTNNTLYIERFQILCEKFGFKPVYLTNYEMAMDDKFADLAKKWQSHGNCEIGVHLHAWNNPPLTELKGPFNGNPYLIEYDFDVMEKKFSTIFNLLKVKFGIHPISHRAGRWATDERYFEILKRFGIKVDCSYTPGINWSLNKGITQGGSNYSSCTGKSFLIKDILEVPVTIKKMHALQWGSFLHMAKSIIEGDNIWMRPATSSSRLMKKLIDIVYKDKNIDYVEFMIHSSELMPGGSPYFQDEDSIEEEYKNIENVFEYAKQQGFIGVTLEEYYKKRINLELNL